MKSITKYSFLTLISHVCIVAFIALLSLAISTFIDNNKYLNIINIKNFILGYSIFLISYFSFCIFGIYSEKLNRTKFAFLKDIILGFIFKYIVLLVCLLFFIKKIGITNPIVILSFLVSIIMHLFISCILSVLFGQKG